MCCWRGVWVLWDALFEASSGAPDGLASGLASHGCGVALLVLGGASTPPLPLRPSAPWLLLLLLLMLLLLLLLRFLSS